MKNSISVSYCLVTYNSVQFVEEAVRSAFNQSYENIEFVISDDGSTDGTFDLIKKIAAEYPHRNIKLSQNITNTGLVPNYEKVFSLATGDIIVVADGDDISLLNRVEILVNLFNIHSEVMCISSKITMIDQFSNVINVERNHNPSLYKLDADYCKSNLFILPGCAPAYRRIVLDKFPGLNADCPTEDSTIRFRALLIGMYLVYNQSLVLYRRHMNNITSNSNVFKIETKGIFNQYVSDIKYAHENLGLKDELYYSLLKKAKRYYKTRELQKFVSTRKGIVKWCLLFYIKYFC